MNKERILAMSRQEHKNEDVFALQVRDQASHWAARAGVLACLIISAVELIVFSRMNYGIWVINQVITSVLALYTVAHIKSRRNTAMAVLDVLLLATFIALYAFDLVRG